MKNSMKRIVSLLLVVAMLACLLPSITFEASAETGYDRGYQGGRGGSGQILGYGVDVSEWQGSGFNFVALKNAGYKYVILRAGFVTRKDNCFETYYANAKAAGLDVGVYFYSYATSVSAASNEADICLNYIRGKKFEYPIYFDFEDGSVGRNGTNAKNMCFAFLDKIAAAGYLAGLYGYASWLDEDYGGWVPTAQICQKYECWIANYPYASSVPSYTAKYKTRYGMFQFTDGQASIGLDPGYGIDTDMVFKDYPTIVKQYGFNGYDANGAASIPDGTYTISSFKDSNFKVDIDGRSTNDGTQAKLKETSGADSQKFVFEACGSGYYFIRNVNSGKYLEILNGGANGEYKVIQQRYIGGDPQKWKLKKNSDNSYAIINKATNKSMDINGGTIADGTDIQVWAANTSDAQKFRLDPVATLKDGVYSVQHIGNNDYYWTIGGNSTDNGANMQMWTAAHQFAIQHDESGLYTIRYLPSDKYINVSGNGTANGTNLIQWADRKASNSQFHAIPNTDGTYSFVANCNGKYIDMDGGGDPKNGTNLQCWSGNNSNAQRWNLIPCKTVNDGLYRLGAFADQKAVMDISGKATDAGTNVWAWETLDAGSQRFAVEYADGWYTIRDVKSNRYVSLEDSGLLRNTNVVISGMEGETVGDNMKFHIIPTLDGFYNLVPACGDNYIDLDGGKTANGTNIHTWSSTMGNTQKWKFMPVLLGGLTEDYLIGCSADDSFVLTIEGASKESGANLEVDKTNGTTSQKFKFLDSGAGYYIIQNVNSGRNLNVNNGGTANGTNVIQYGTSKTDTNEHWSIIPHVDGTYGIATRKSGMYLDLSGGKLEDGNNIHIWSTSPGNTNQRWKLSTHTHKMSDKVVAPTCTEKGYTSHTCSECGAVLKDTYVDALGHDYDVVTTPANCTDLGKKTFTCKRCGHSYVEYIEPKWSEWSTEKPTGVDEAKIRSRVVYQYRDHETKVSNEANLPGYTVISERWLDNGSGTVKYVKSWPAGFDKGNSNYTTYNKTAPTASETATAKRTVGNETTAGYIYWHWCRNYTGGPINRYVEDTRKGEYTTFHAFFSTTNPSSLSGADGCYNHSNSSVCKDTYWFYALEVKSRSYNDYKKEFTYEKWTDWTNWSEAEPETKEGREINSRTEYSFIINDVQGDHVWDNGVVTKAATCLENGVKTYTCTVCKTTKTETIAAAGQHTWNSGTVTKAATCTENGVKTFTCTTCKQTKTETIAATGHKWDNGKITGGASCGGSGVKTFTCTVCGATRTEAVEAMGHTPVTDPAKAPTCTEAGLTEGSHCSVCGTVIVAQNTIPAKGHEEVMDWGTPATCTQPGSTDGIHCSVCNAVIVPQETIPAKGHKWTDGEVTKQPTCTETGSKLVSCTVCHTNRTETIPAKGHTPITVPGKPATCYEAGLTDGSKCAVCNATLTAQTTIPTTGHTPVTDAGKAPTCTETGLSDGSHCSVCGTIITARQTIPAKGHTPVSDPAKQPTCTEPGKTAGTHCADCGVVISGQEVIPALGHQWDEGKVTVPPTCSRVGTRTTTCSVCKQTRTESIPTTDHTVVTQPGKAATCLEDGLTEGRYCSVCGTVLAEQTVIPAPGHLWNKGNITVPATCVKEGSKLMVCVSCAATRTETIPATGHTPLVTAAKPATCTEKGCTEGSTCTTCGVVLTEAQTLPALGHNWDSGVVTVDPVCPGASSTKYICLRCGESKIEASGMEGHTIVADTAKAPSCTEDGRTQGSHCSACGAIIEAQQVIPALGHNWQAGVLAVEPDCVNPGVMTYSCARCAVTRGEAIPALGHQIVNDPGKAPTCTEEGLSEGSHCVICNTIFALQQPMPPKGHSYVASGHLDCTETVNGYDEYTCSVCKNTYRVTIPASGCPSAHLKDVKQGAWYHEYVDFMVGNGFMNGIGDVFSLNTSLSRAMLVQTLYRIENEPASEDFENPFSDVKEKHWFYAPVMWAAKNGIVDGYSDGTFKPNNPVTREQFATILFRYVGSPTVEGDHLASFPDCATVHTYGKDGLNWAVANGYISGNKIDGVDMLAPRANATRAQSATILTRFLKDRGY